MPTFCPPSPKTSYERARKTVAQIRKNPMKLAEREGFEPSVPVTQYARLAIWCLRPLGHLSASAVRLDHLDNAPRRYRPRNDITPFLERFKLLHPRTLDERGISPRDFRHS